MLDKQIITQGEEDTPRNKQRIKFTVILAKADTNQLLCEAKYPHTAVIGHNQINPLIEKALLTMKVGQKATFKISRQEAQSLEIFSEYGSHDLIMTINLVEVGNIMTDPKYSTLQQKQQKAHVLKQEGNDLIKQKKYELSIQKYLEALNLIQYQTTQQSLQLRVSTLLNLALAHINNKQYQKALENCQYILRQDPLNLKAIYRKASSLRFLGHFERAVLTVKHTLESNPENQEFQNLLKQLKQQQQINKKKEKQLYSKMFSDS